MVLLQKVVLVLILSISRKFIAYYNLSSCRFGIELFSRCLKFHTGKIYFFIYKIVIIYASLFKILNFVFKKIKFYNKILPRKFN